MIKELTSALLLTAAITNTQITSHINRIVYMDNESYWTINSYYEEDAFNENYIKAYRNISTTSEINNESFHIQQRTEETYFFVDGEIRPTCEQKILINIEKKNTIDYLTYINTTLVGSVINFYPFGTGAISIWVEEDIDIAQNATLENYLNGTSYTTEQQYQTLNNQLNSTFLYANIYENITLTNQNYANVLNNYELDYTTETQASNIAIYIIIGFDYDSPELPIQEPYSPFGNYARQINYDVGFTTTVQPGGQGEIVDIPGMMLMMLGMPFTFMAQAFNLTIFPGTMYEVNLAHIAIAIFGAAILLFIIKRFLK